jgi:sugar lactone lactonase YvrE
MWVEVTTDKGLALDIFDPHGRQLGRVASPPRNRANVPFSRDNYLYVVTGDSAEEPAVTVYEILMGDGAPR